MLKKLFKSTFVRYMVTYILLTAILVGGIMLYMYSYYRSSIYSSTVSGETSLAYQLRYMTDGCMDSVESFARQVSTASESGASSALADFNPAEGALTYVYFSSGDRVVSASDSRAFSDFFAECGADMNYDELYELVTAGETTLKGTRDIKSGRLCVAAAVPLPSGRGSVLCLLPESAFEVNDTRTDSTACNRYIIKDGRLIICAESFDMPEERIMAAGTRRDSVHTEKKRLSGREYLFISVPGEKSDTVYVSVLTLSGIHTKAASLWLGFTAVLMLIAVPCVVFMILISRRNLLPIQQMSRRFSANAEQNTDEISVITRGIRDLEDKNRELETHSLTARRHMFAKSLIRDDFDSVEDARRAGDEIGIDVNKQYFAVLLVGAPRDRRQDIYLESVLAPAPDGVSCVGTDLLESEQMLVAAFADEVKLLDDYARRICAMEPVRLMRVPVAMSAVHDDFSKLSTAFLEATSAYESRFVMGDARLLNYSEIPLAAAKPTPGAQIHARNISKALEEGNREQLESCLSELNRYLRSGDMNLFTFRQVYNDIIGAILSQAAGSGYAGREIYDLFSLSGCRSPEELEDVLKNVCEAVISARVQDNRQPLIQEIIRIMTENYTNSDFTLTAAAELAGVPAARMSAEFKTNMGMTPNDYLTMLRMEEAKKLLRQTDLPVGDVCGLSGYSDASSFTRRFKQYTGSTPLNFRQSVRGTAEEEDG